MTRARRNKKINLRRKVALDTLKMVKEPNKRELKEIEILEQRVKNA